MANEKMMLITKAKILAAGAGAAALITAVIAYKELKDAKSRSLTEKRPTGTYTICPTCGMVINKKHRTCRYCHCTNQICASCGQLYHEHARFCPKCGAASKTAGEVVSGGITYKGPINEPFPTDHVSYAFCCCGTPFATRARYCQLCGMQRPKRGTFYLREGRIPGNG